MFVRLCEVSGANSTNILYTSLSDNFSTIIRRHAVHWGKLKFLNDVADACFIYNQF
jgi:hypothetical protein